MVNATEDLARSAVGDGCTSGVPSSVSDRQPPTPPSSSQPSPSIKRKLLLLLPLLVTLYLLTDSAYYNSNADLMSSLPEPRTKGRHLAFVTALARHPPSLRIFRIVGEGAFLLSCAAFALWVWEGAADAAAGGRGAGSQKDDILEEEHGVDFRNDSGEPKITITVVGKLLFAPPPDSITTNAAWVVYKQHRSRRRRRRKPNSPRKKQRKLRLKEGGSMERSTSEGGDDVQADGEEGSGELTTVPLEQPEKQQHHQQQQQHATRTQPPSSIPLPPSSTAVLGAALDLFTLLCMLLILFTISSAEGGRYIEFKRDADAGPDQSAAGGGTQSEEEGGGGEIIWMKLIANVATPLFSLTLLVVSTLWLIFPWKKRRDLYTILSLTVGAPFYEVTFRDGFVGDVLTSTVRPLQDMAFTVFFLVGLMAGGFETFWNREVYDRGYLNEMDGKGASWERSWMLHTVVLPACTLSPLWYRFLQNLRQCYDAKQRWPYLGNATKYMLAAEVATFGVFNPSVKSHPLWISCFFAATMYQIWWDVFMDWGLLERDNSLEYDYYYGNGGDRDRNRSWLWRWPYSLRSRRLYRGKWVYFAIFFVNFCLRFVGMMTLIPPSYLCRTTGLIVNTYHDPDFQLFVGSLIACAEIFRRTIWALLRLEWEVIKSSPAQSTRRSAETDESIRPTSMREVDNDFLPLEMEDMKPMSIASSEVNVERRGPTWERLWPSGRSGGFTFSSLSDMTGMNDIQVLSELCVWATMFSGVAIIAAAHREVL